MKMFETEKLLADLGAKVDQIKEKADAYNVAFRKSDVSEMGKLKEDVSSLVKEERKLAELITSADQRNLLVFNHKEDEYTAEEFERDLKIALVKLRTYDFTGVMFKDGKSAEVKQMSDKIDILAMMEKFGFGISYKHDISYLGLILTLQLIKDTGSVQDISKVTGCYKLTQLARQKLETGVDPLSKTQTVRALQSCIDSFLFIGKAEDLTKNAIRVTNYDWNFLTLALTKGTKNSTNKVDVLAPSKVYERFFDVVHNLLLSKSYEICYKEDKKLLEKQTEEPKAEEPKPEEPKAEEPKPEAPKATRKPRAKAKKAE